VALSVASCSRALPGTNLAALAVEARMIASVATDEFPVITALKAESITTKPDGVYITMGRQFGEEWGFFVPRDPESKPQAGGDPRFELLRDGVYRHDVAG
ncbi:MAG: hypothetical protein ABMA14_17260, partial [Hyphomonadaceae bacterium]